MLSVRPGLWRSEPEAVLRGLSLRYQAALHGLCAFGSISETVQASVYFGFKMGIDKQLSLVSTRGHPVPVE